MRSGELDPLGGDGSIAEADETFIGNKKGAEKRRGYSHKMAVLALVERGGPVRTFHIDKTRTKDIKPIVEANLDRESMLMTDEATYYTPIGKGYKHHFTVDHGSVEGRLQTVSERGGFKFVIYDILWDRPIRCHLPETLIDRAMEAFGHRVEVYGLVTYRRDGKPLSIKVDAIEPLTVNRHIPSFREVYGILRDSS